MSLKCELNQRATNTKSTSIMVPVVPWSGKHPSKHTHSQKHLTHTCTRQTNGENRSDNVPWEHIFPQLTPSKLLIVRNCFLSPHCQWPRWLPWVCGYLLLWQPIARCRLKHHAVAALGRGKSIAGRTKRISFSFCIFLPVWEERWLMKGNHHHQRFKAPAPRLQGAHSSPVEAVTTHSASAV